MPLRRNNGRNGPRLKQEVSRKWRSFVRSSNRTWVDYDEGRDTRSRVDFKDGIIHIETVIPEEDPKALKTARRKITAQTRKILETKAGPRRTGA